jgi:hypothetical protein
MEIDPFSETASLPKCFVVPIASKDIKALKKYVGEFEPIEKYPNDAFIVKFEKTECSNNFDVWNHPRSYLINYERQLWVDVDFKNFNKVYRSEFPEFDITDDVHIDHLMNRRLARIFGYKYIRLIHVNNSTNVSSGAGAEKLAVDMHGDIELDKEAQMQYADPFELAKILDLQTGGRPFLDIRDLYPLFYDGESIIGFYKDRLINMLKYIYGFDKVKKAPCIKKITRREILLYNERIMSIEREIAKIKFSKRKQKLKQ